MHEAVAVSLKRMVNEHPAQSSSYIYSSVRAFSIYWPYVCFSGLENFLLVVNLYDSKILHRIQLGPLDEYIFVCQTFISNTKDLMVVIKKDKVFKVILLDLDQTNPLERKVEESSWKFETIMEYPIEEVGNTSLDFLYVRGSSRKELIQLN